MATYTLDQYQRVWRKRAVELRKAAKKSSRDAASFMVATAKGMSPLKTGALRTGIISKPIKDAEYEVSSSVAKEFPYNLWVNQTAPFRTINAVWNGRNPTVYGDGTHRITGTPRFWHFATLRTYALFSRITRKNIQNVLKVRII